MLLGFAWDCELYRHQKASEPNNLKKTQNQQKNKKTKQQKKKVGGVEKRKIKDKKENIRKCGSKIVPPRGSYPPSTLAGKGIINSNNKGAFIVVQPCSLVALCCMERETNAEKKKPTKHF